MPLYFVAATNTSGPTSRQLLTHVANELKYPYSRWISLRKWSARTRPLRTLRCNWCLKHFTIKNKILHSSPTIVATSFLYMVIQPTPLEPFSRPLWFLLWTLGWTVQGRGNHRDKAHPATRAPAPTHVHPNLNSPGIVVGSCLWVDLFLSALHHLRNENLILSISGK